jgi:hypothetical protein
LIAFLVTLNLCGIGGTIELINPETDPTPVSLRAAALPPVIGLEASSAKASDVFTTETPLKPNGNASPGTILFSTASFMTTLILLDLFGYLPRLLILRSVGEAESKLKKLLASPMRAAM